MFKIKLITLSVLLSAVLNAQFLTGWGTGDFTSSYVDGTFSQTSTTSSWSASADGMILSGDFAPVALLGIPPSIDLELTFNAEYSGQFDLVIGSSTGGVLGYSKNLDKVNGALTVSFNRLPANDVAPINLATISFVALTAPKPNFTLNSLTANAIPEPASFTGFAGLAVLGFTALRRRRA